MVADSVLAKAYKTKLMAVHPDKNPGNESDAKKKTVLLVNAWGRLKDPTLRSLDDNERKAEGLDTQTRKSNIYIHIYTTDIVQIGSWELLKITIHIYIYIHIYVYTRKGLIEKADVSGVAAP